MLLLLLWLLFTYSFWQFYAVYTFECVNDAENIGTVYKFGGCKSFFLEMEQTKQVASCWIVVYAC